MKKIDFAVARTKHLAWKTQLRSFLDGKQTLTEAQAVSHKDCDLGKWLYSEGITKYGSVAEMKELERVHVELHATVKNIVQMKNAANVAGAEQEFKKVAGISQRIVNLLTVIEQKAA